MDLKNRLKELAGAALVAALLGCSMAFSLLDALSVHFSPWMAGLYSMMTVLFLAALLLHRLSALGATLCLSGGIAFLLVRNPHPIETLREIVISLLRAFVTGEGSVNEHALLLTLALTMVMTLIAFLLSRLSGGVYPALLMFVFVMMGCWFLEKRLTPLYVAPGLVALAVLYARAWREGASYMRAVPAALIAAILAICLVPGGQPTWKPLRDAAQMIQELFSDYFLFTEPRTVYSVASDGYQPLGETLGGPAAPRDAEVMNVQTDHLLLLRGSVRRTYTGYSWVDSAINSRYLYIDPTRQSMRNEIFDIDLSEALSSGYTEASAHVEFLNEGISALFVPHRLKSLSMPIDLVAYYNESGEVFITRGVEYGDSYSFTAFLPAGREALSLLAASVTPGSDPHYTDIQKSYTNLPIGLDNDVYWLTQRITEQAATPFEKAEAIQRYLLSDEFTYRLDVSYPPENRDFVSYFLLESKEGYCTYYASAMAVMARLAGLPSRYVEGYLVPVEPDGDTLVTGNNAHAWTEIYFEGLGWLPFDATPGHENDGSNTPDHQQPNGPTPTPTPSPTPSPTPTPDPGEGNGADDPNPDTQTATPTPSPTPAPDAEQPDSSEPTATPTPPPDAQEPEPSPSVPPEQPDNQPPNEFLKYLLWALLFLLLIALLIWLVYRRLKQTDPAFVANHQQDADIRLLVWYRVMLALLQRSGFAPEGGETPEQFAGRMVSLGNAPKALIEFSQAVTAQQYAHSAPSADTFLLAQEIYQALLTQMGRRDRLRWHLYRLLHGLGNYRQIP